MEEKKLIPGTMITVACTSCGKTHKTTIVSREEKKLTYSGLDMVTINHLKSCAKQTDLLGTITFENKNEHLFEKLFLLKNEELANAWKKLSCVQYRSILRAIFLQGILRRRFVRSALNRMTKMNFS